MARPPLPRFIADVVEDRPARATLLAGAAALFAAGLDPKVWGPSLTTVQSAIRARPELESYVLIGAVGFAIMLLIGGAIGDLRRVRPLILGGLAVLIVTDAIGLVVTSGPPFIAARLVGSAASALVVPASLACVALAYHGVARATAIGFAYAAYGGAQALMPTLLTLIPGERWPGFAAAALAAGLALAIARNRVPELERPGRAERPYVLGTALWASSIVAISAGLLWLGSGWDNPIRLAIVGLGIALLVTFFAWEARRRAEHPASLRVDRRPVTIALFAGVVIAIAQSVPMVLLPTYFAIVPRYGPLFGLAAVAPLFLGLVLAGPIAGYLLSRLSPRVLVAAGLVVVGLGNLLVAVIAGPGTGYVLFVFPLLFIGVGFVIATTVRTAIIFASVPRGLPATAAALNEASIAVGNRIGNRARDRDRVAGLDGRARRVAERPGAAGCGDGPAAVLGPADRGRDAGVRLARRCGPAVGRRGLHRRLRDRRPHRPRAGRRGGGGRRFRGLVRAGPPGPARDARRRPDGVGLRAPRRARHRGVVTWRPERARDNGVMPLDPLRVDRVPLDDDHGAIVVLTLDRPGTS